jgi:hypothetical protein
LLKENSGHKDFRRVQRQFAAQIRSPGSAIADNALDDIEPRRLQIYQDLFFNNIESFLASGFPVLRSLYEDAEWLSLVRQFISQHACQSPYFLQIGAEFLGFLEHGYVSGSTEPAFIRELAHYEWVELALDVAKDEIPADAEASLPTLDACIEVSPLAWPLVYQYPVHKINAQFRPNAPGDEPTCLLVYRNRADTVQFIETNPITVHLLQMLDETSGLTAREVLRQIASELGYGTDQDFVAFGGATLESFRQLGIVVAR